MEPPDEDRLTGRHLLPASERSFLSLLGDLKDDCIQLGQQKYKLAKLRLTTHADQVRKYTGIAIAGALIGLVGLGVLLIGLSTWVAMIFGSASVAIAAGHTIVGGLVAAAGGLTAYLASQKLPEGSMLPSSPIADVVNETEQVAEDVAEDEAEAKAKARSHYRDPRTDPDYIPNT